jgi:hypothetical protein
MKKAGFVHNRVKYLNFNGQNEITFFDIFSKTESINLGGGVKYMIKTRKLAVDYNSQFACLIKVYTSITANFLVFFFFS